MKKIIIVEDDDTQQKLIGIILKSDPKFAEFEVEFYDNAENFPGEFESDLVVTDLHSPMHKSGLKVVAKCKKCGVPCILMTSDWESLKTEDKEGLAAFILKPYNVDNFLSTVKKALKI